MSKVDVAVIGGGFYGCCLALLMRGYFKDVVVIEKEDDLLLRASAINQARIHTGYHYPRSLVTAYRSFVNFPRFVVDFRQAVVSDFTKLYAIARKGSKVNARRFYEMFRQMHAQISIAAPEYQRMFNKDLVEEIFLVKEMAFDVTVLRKILREKLEKAGVRILLQSEVRRIEPCPDGRLAVVMENGGLGLVAEFVFNCAYSRINRLLANSGLEMFPLKHEVTEMSLIRVPEELERLGVTVMDGPYFSIMPYPSRRLHTLSHVRYTPHHHWVDTEEPMDGHRYLSEAKLESNFAHMIRDAQRYMPVLKHAEFIDSLFEIKTVLIQNEVDDGRPILYRADKNLKNFATIMGAKIDNIYDVLAMITDVRKNLGVDSNVWRYLFPGQG